MHMCNKICANAFTTLTFYFIQLQAHFPLYSLLVTLRIEHASQLHNRVQST